jgi:hypothetical protein
VKRHKRSISSSQELITVATGLADGDEPVDDENRHGDVRRSCEIDSHYCLERR